MSRNSRIFPEAALYIHPSIIFVEFDFTFTEYIYYILSLQICFRSNFW
jgi:hypothetical protein